MDVQFVKEYIQNNNCIDLILEDLGCHSIKHHSHYITAGNPNGDNKQSITVYLDNLSVINYTRDLPSPSDIFTLVQFFKEISFFQALKHVCNILGLDFYQNENEHIPKSLQITKELKSMMLGETYEDNTPIKPIDEKILSYYKTPCVNDFWLKDNVPYEMQVFWELGFDNATNRITIPIRDETGVLCGIKSRIFKEKLDPDDLKFMYLESCPRNKILYGLFKSYPYLKRNNMVFCLEAEKAVHQLWSYGYRNAVATGGEKVSKCQIDKLSRLAVPICFAFDSDVSEEKIQSIADQFINGIEVYAIFDRDNLLEEKESPSDDLAKWKKLIKNNIYKIK
jgi:DNA primase